MNMFGIYEKPARYILYTHMCCREIFAAKLQQINLYYTWVIHE